MVQFVGVEQMVGLLSTVGVEPFLAGLAEAIEGEFLRWEQFDKVSRVASHSAAGVIELMPVSDDDFYAFKYVNGHPANTRDGLQTVTAFGALADVATGYPLLLSEMTLLTALRTAATSALAARHLARRDATVMAIIGLGASRSSRRSPSRRCWASAASGSTTSTRSRRPSSRPTWRDTGWR